MRRYITTVEPQISDKTSDPVKQAFHGLLKLDDVSDGSTHASEENTNSEGQRRIPHGRLLSQVSY